MTTLGRMYYRGDGVEQDYNKAFKFLKYYNDELGMWKKPLSSSERQKKGKTINEIWYNLAMDRDICCRIFCESTEFPKINNKYWKTPWQVEYSAVGNPSTVFSYTHAIKKVLDEEGISWGTLQSEIKNIIPVYDLGGAKQHIRRFAAMGASKSCICPILR